MFFFWKKKSVATIYRKKIYMTDVKKKEKKEKYSSAIFNKKCWLNLKKMLIYGVPKNWFLFGVKKVLALGGNIFLGVRLGHMAKCAICNLMFTIELNYLYLGVVGVSLVFTVTVNNLSAISWRTDLKGEIILGQTQYTYKQTGETFDHM